MNETKRGQLPPAPIFPKRSLTPPTRRSISGTFLLDGDTPTRTVDSMQLGALVSIFEELTPKERDELILIGDVLRLLPEDFKQKLFELASALHRKKKNDQRK